MKINVFIFVAAVWYALLFVGCHDNQEFNDSSRKTASCNEDRVVNKEAAPYIMSNERGVILIRNISEGASVAMPISIMASYNGSPPVEFSGNLVWGVLWIELLEGNWRIVEINFEDTNGSKLTRKVDISFDMQRRDMKIYNVSPYFKEE